MPKSPTINPYLAFNGRCDEALEFYKKALGAKVPMLMRFKEAPDKSMIKPGMEEKVMHARIEVGGAVFFVSDGQCEGAEGFHGIALTLTVGSEAEADKYFKGLSEGAKVNMPLAKTFFSPKFGMLQDRFGVGWMVMVEALK